MKLHLLLEFRAADLGIIEQASEISKHLEFHIDYEKMGRDMEMSGDVYTIETAHDEVHIFWAH